MGRTREWKVKGRGKMGELEVHEWEVEGMPKLNVIGS